jgi:hypothetical protein
MNFRHKHCCNNTGLKIYLREEATLTHRLSARGKLCPFLKNPCKECYCNSMSSQDVEKTVFFCTTGFKTCEIYKSHICRTNKETSHFI